MSRSGCHGAAGVLLGIPGPRGDLVDAAVAGTRRWWVARRSVDATALVGAAQAGIGSVCVAAPALPDMDIDHAAVLADIMPLVLLPATSTEGARVRHWPATTIVNPHAGVSDVLAAVEAIGNPATGPGPVGSDSSRAQVVAVWGPTGAPGRSVVATNLAAECAELGAEVLLMDADPHGGAVAAMLALAPGPSSLLAAIRRADDQARLPSIAVTSRWRVLTGATDGESWHEFRPARWRRVIDRARQQADVVVIDCGFDIAGDALYGPESAVPTRSAATVVAIAEADALVVVGTPDAVGLPRLVDAILRVRQLPARQWGRSFLDRAAARGSAAAREVYVLNRVRVEPQRAIDSLARHVGARVDVLVPNDEDTLMLALSAGQALAGVAPTAPIRCALRDLARVVTNWPLR